MKNPLHKTGAGFTMLEIIAVLMVVAILAAMAIARGMGNDDAVAEANSLKSKLRFAQLRAMSDVVMWGVQVNSDTLVLLSDESPATVFFPDVGSNTYDLPDGVTIIGGTATIQFDDRGRPYTGTGISVHPLDADYTITVGGDPNVTVTITEETGFIP